MTSFKKIAAKHDMQYVNRVPKKLPPGKKLCHNFPPGPAKLFFEQQTRGVKLPLPDGVEMTGPRGLGWGGFRAWFFRKRHSGFRVCDCGWAPHLPRHYTNTGHLSKGMKGLDVTGKFRRLVRQGGK